MKILQLAIAILIGLVALGVLVFGPRGNAALPTDRVIVDYWEKWTGNEEQQMRSIVDEFNETVGAEKGIFVRYISTSSINQKTLVATAAGVPPDIAGLWDFNLVQFASLDALEPLEDLAAEHGISASYYKPAYWNACNYNGHLWCLISTPSAVALHYNKRMFAEAGLDPDRPPQTIDELDRYAKQMTILDSSGRVKRAGYIPMEPGWFVNYTCLWFGAEFWDAASQKFTLTDPRIVQAYRWIQSYSKLLGSEAITTFQSGFGNFDSPQNAFLADQVAMEQQGPWMANFIYKQRPGMSTLLWPKEQEMTMPLAERRRNYEWAVEAFPSAVPGLKDVTYCGFDLLAIPRGARHKREAFEFIAWVNRQDISEKLNKLHCKNSPLAKVSQDFLEHHPNPYVDVFERLANSPNARTCPQLPIMPEVIEELNVLGQQTALMRVDPEKALLAIQARLQAKYDQFVAQQKARKSMARLER